jgi:hypothetical protein
MSGAPTAHLLDGTPITLGFGPTSLEYVRSWTGLEFLRKIMADGVAQPTIHQTLNFRLFEISEGKATFTGVPSSECLNPPGNNSRRL